MIVKLNLNLERFWHVTASGRNLVYEVVAGGGEMLQIEIKEINLLKMTLL